jgi:hypothetical protein
VAAVAVEHRLHRPLRDAEETAQVHTGHEVVVLVGVLGERLGDEHTGVVDEGVDVAERGQCPVHDARGDGGIGDVTGDGQHLLVVGRRDGA